MTFEEGLTGNSMKYTETLERMKDRKSGSPLMLIMKILKKVLRAAVVVEYLGKHRTHIIPLLLFVNWKV